MTFEFHPLISLTLAEGSTRTGWQWSAECFQDGCGQGDSLALTVSEYTAHSALGEELMELLHATNCSWRSLRLHDDNSRHYHPGCTADLPGTVPSQVARSSVAASRSPAVAATHCSAFAWERQSIEHLPGSEDPFAIWHLGYLVSVKRRRGGEERGRAGRRRGHDTAAEGEVMRIWVPIKMPLNAPLSDCRKHPSAQPNTRYTYNKKSRQSLCKFPPDSSETLCGHVLS